MLKMAWTSAGRISRASLSLTCAVGRAAARLDQRKAARRRTGVRTYAEGVGLFPRRCAMCHSLTPPRKQNTTDRLTELTAVDAQRQRSVRLVRCRLPPRSVQAPLGILTASVYHSALFGRVGLHASCVWSQCGRHRLHQRAELDLHPARHLNAVPSRRTASE